MPHMRNVHTLQACGQAVHRAEPATEPAHLNIKHKARAPKVDAHAGPRAAQASLCSAMRQAGASAALGRPVQQGSAADLSAALFRPRESARSFCMCLHCSAACQAGASAATGRPVQHGMHALHQLSRQPHLCRATVGYKGWLHTFLNATPRCLPFFLQHSMRLAQS